MQSKRNLMVRVPPSLKKGDTIGLVCPAGYMSAEKTEVCISTLEDWGYRVKTGTTIGGDSTNYFSASDKERLNDLQRMLDDPGIHAILCARGGYGVGRIIDDIDFSLFKKHPKWIIGYSDITVLHSHIYSNYKISTLHSPMASAFDDEGYSNEFVQSLRNVLEGKKIRYEAVPHIFNIKGEGIGELVGGNLTMVAHLVGTNSDVKTKGRILFLEDVGEYLYNIDRMFYQLKRAGRLDKLAGLIIGGFTDPKDTERPFGKTAYEIIHDITKGADYPVCFGFPVSHGKENYALKTGIGYKLKVTGKKITLEE